MAKFFKYPAGKGKPLKYAKEQGCSWCWWGERPQHGQTICEACRSRFKGLLCSNKWQKARKAFLSIPVNAICNHCRSRRDATTAADEVNHKYPWRFFPDLFWVAEHWEGVCKSCHQTETNENHGGFGRPIILPSAPPSLSPENS